MIYFSTQATYNELGLMLGEELHSHLELGSCLWFRGTKISSSSLGGTSETLMTFKPSGNSASSPSDMIFSQLKFFWGAMEQF